MKAALIGNGFIGADHRNAYKLLAEEGSFVELVAVCDIREEKRQETNGARAYASVDEMLASEKDLDFVDICLPTYLHAEYTIKCMEAGLHVLCEKPMALTYEDTQRMIECSRKTGKKLMIAHSCRFSSTYKIIHDFVVEGEFGKPQSAFLHRVGGRPMWGWEDWLNREECSGGAIYDIQAHDVDIATWCFGEPKAVSVVASRRKDGAGYDSVSSNHIYDDGLFVNIWVDFEVKGNKHQGGFTRVNFENGYIYRDTTGGNKSILAVDRDGNETDLSGTVKMPPSTKRNEIEYFAQCIRDDKYPEWCPPEQSASTIKNICAQVKSADQSGMPVYLD